MGPHKELSADGGGKLDERNNYILGKLPAALGGFR
jgi:hypothetical protein